MTEIYHNCVFEKFRGIMLGTEKLKFISKGKYFDVLEIIEFLKTDNILLSKIQVISYLNNMVKLGEVICFGNTIYMMHSELKAEELPVVVTVDYKTFCNILLSWKTTGEIITLRQFRNYLNSKSIFLPYFMLRDYLLRMVVDKMLIKYSKKRYQLVTQKF